MYRLRVDLCCMCFIETEAWIDTRHLWRRSINSRYQRKGPRKSFWSTLQRLHALLGQVPVWLYEEITSEIECLFRTSWGIWWRLLQEKFFICMQTCARDILTAVSFDRNTMFMLSVLRKPLFSRTCLIEKPETCEYSFHVSLKVLCIYLFIGFFFFFSSLSCKCPEGREERIDLLFCVYKNLPEVQEQPLAR